jgi:hypothetical protein
VSESVDHIPNWRTGLGVAYALDLCIVRGQRDYGE